MSDCQVSIQIEAPFAGLIDEDWAREVVVTTLATAGIQTPTEIGLVIAGDETVHELNRSYRGIDDTTDVLSFALCEESDRESEGFVMPPDETLHLGEIIISCPQAKLQADEQQHTLERELALLITHGTLHLLGYDHIEPEGEQCMRALEARVLAEITRDKPASTE
jgi:probable rRNA maturation factor